MNPVEITVDLKCSDDVDYLIFNVDNSKYPEGIKVNLNAPSGQNDFLDVFSGLLEILEHDRVVLNLHVPDDYERVLYKDVVTEYIGDINKELETVYSEIQHLAVAANENQTLRCEEI